MPWCRLNHPVAANVQRNVRPTRVFGFKAALPLRRFNGNRPFSATVRHKHQIRGQQRIFIDHISKILNDWIKQTV